MKIFFDADLILETLLNRSGLVENVEDIFEILQGEQVQGYVSELGLEKIHSIAKRLGDPETADTLISRIKELIKISPVDSTLLRKARSLSFVDFESAVEVVCATQMNIGAIVTCNPRCFDGSGLPTLQVSDLWKRQYLERILQKDASSVLLVGELLDIQRLEKLLEKSSKCLRDVEISNENRQLSDTRQNFDAQFKSYLNSENCESLSIFRFIEVTH
ncbi:MAG: PIN domain-containing protein [Cyanobacteria bacterium P01_G01_bin.49]